MDIEYWFEMPNKWTFKQKKLREFILKYIPKNSNVLIPFAGQYRFDKSNNCKFIYNDLNHEIKADYNIAAWKLKNIFNHECFDVIIADPPYTHFQWFRKYNKAKKEGNEKNFKTDITLWRETVNYLLTNNGIYIELGFNSSGLKKIYAEKIALGICCLGGSHNDILILVQQKIKKREIEKNIDDIYIINQTNKKLKNKKIWNYYKPKNKNKKEINIK